MKYNRICVLGTPRSGSQFVTRLLSGTVSAVNLAEPFTLDNKTITVDGLNNLVISNIVHDTTNIDIKDLFYKHSNYVLNCIEQANKQQHVVFKLFEYYGAEYKFIIDRLKNCNFDFIVLKRINIEQQLLSYAYALSTGKFSKFKGDTDIENKITITDVEFNGMRWLYNQISNFDTFINSLDIKYSTINYETSINDIELITGKKINNTQVDITKQVLANPYNNIYNAEEVKHFIKNITNGT